MGKVTPNTHRRNVSYFYTRNFLNNNSEATLFQRNRAIRVLRCCDTAISRKNSLRGWTRQRNPTIPLESLPFQHFAKEKLSLPYFHRFVERVKG